MKRFAYTNEATAPFATPYTRDLCYFLNELGVSLRLRLGSLPCRLACRLGTPLTLRTVRYAPTLQAAHALTHIHKKSGARTTRTATPRL